MTDINERNSVQEKAEIALLHTSGLCEHSWKISLSLSQQATWRRSIGQIYSRFQEINSVSNQEQIAQEIQLNSTNDESNTCQDRSRSTIIHERDCIWNCTS